MTPPEAVEVLVEECAKMRLALEEMIRRCPRCRGRGHYSGACTAGTGCSELHDMPCDQCAPAREALK